MFVHAQLCDYINTIQFITIKDHKFVGLLEFNVSLSHTVTDISKPCQPEKLITLLP